MSRKSLTIKYIKKSTAMDKGETLFLPCESKREQELLYKEVLQELRAMALIDPVSASELISNAVTRDGRLWVVIKRISASPTTVFLKKMDGTVERVDLDSDTERFRRLELMVRDGLSLSDIEELEGSLTEEEVKFVKGRK